MRFCAFKIHFTVGRKNLKLLTHKGEGWSGKCLEVEKYLAGEEDVGGEEEWINFSADGRKESWELKILEEDIHTKVTFNRFCTMNNEHTHLGRPFGSFSRFASEKLCLVCTSSNMNS